MFISTPHNGYHYNAERSRKGSRKFLSSVMPQAPTAGDIRIEACRVPRLIRRKAYRVLRKHDEGRQP